MGKTIRRSGPKAISVRSIAERLKQDIIKGALQPNQRMIEDDLAKRFAVSRTPIREAMRTLESVGYVTFTPHRGWKVKEISVDPPGTVVPDGRVGDAPACGFVRDGGVDHEGRRERSATLPEALHPPV